MASALTSYRAAPIEHLPPSAKEARDVPGFTPTSTMDSSHQLLASGDPISRPSSTSTTQSATLHHSASMPQLPGLSSLASVASGRNSPQLRYGYSCYGLPDIHSLKPKNYAFARSRTSNIVFSFSGDILTPCQYHLSLSGIYLIHDIPPTAMHGHQKLTLSR